MIRPAASGFRQMAGPALSGGCARMPSRLVRSDPIVPEGSAELSYAPVRAG